MGFPRWLDKADRFFEWAGLYAWWSIIKYALLCLVISVVLWGLATLSTLPWVARFYATIFRWLGLL